MFTRAKHVTRIEVREVEFRIAIRRIFGIGMTLHRQITLTIIIAKIMIGYRNVTFEGPRGASGKFSRLAIAGHILRPLINYAIIRPLLPLLGIFLKMWEFGGSNLIGIWGF